MAILELSVNLDCPGCGRKIRRALQKLDGVDNVDIDMELQKVTVTGYVDHDKVLKTVARTGKSVELWPVPFNPLYHNFDEYYSDQYPSQNSNPNPNPPINYYQNVNPPINYYQYQVTETNPPTNYYDQPPPYSVFNQPTSAMFSDENTHACTIM